MASVRIDDDCNEIVAHLPGVRAELKATAEAGAVRARSILARHRHAGDSKITVTRGDKLDYFVNLEDEGGAAAAIEFGRSGGNRGATQGVGAISGAF